MDKKKLKEIIACDTDVFDQILEDMYTGQEEKAITAFGSNSFTKEEVKELLKITEECVQKFLDEGYAKGIFNKIIQREQVRYETVTLYYYLDCFVLADKKRWNSYPKEFIKAADQWYFEKYCERVEARMQTEDDKPSEEVLPLKEALEFIDQVENPIYILPCDCCAITANNEDAEDWCIQYLPQEVNSMIDRGFGKKISKEEAKELVRRCDERGLIHSPTKYHYCNCNPKYCYPFRCSQLRGNLRKWPKSHAVIQIDVEKCVGCKACVKRCPMDAIEIKEKKAVVNESNCVGCGVCRVACKKEALSLKYWEA